MSFIDSAHNPLPSSLSWFRRICSRVPLPLFDLSTKLLCILQEHARVCVCVCWEALWVRFWCPPPAPHCKPIQPVSTTAPLPSTRNFSHSSPTRLRGFFLQGGNFQTPLPKLKEVWVGVAAGVIFSSISFLLSWFFFFILFLLRYAWYARLQNGCCERSGVRQAAPFSHSLSRSLSPPQSLAPSPSLLPVSHCTSPPFHFLSLPLLPSHSHRHTEICTSLAFHNYCCAIANHVNQEDLLPQIQREQIAPDEYVRLNKSGEKEKKIKLICRSSTQQLNVPGPNFFCFILSLFFAGGSNICKLSGVAAKTATKLQYAAQKWPQLTSIGSLTIYN